MGQSREGRGGGLKLIDGTRAGREKCSGSRSFSKESLEEELMNWTWVELIAREQPRIIPRFLTRAG